MATTLIADQKIPASGKAREKLREAGQFWTPMWLAEAMAGWVLQDDPKELFDPAVGPGIFFAAARKRGFRGALAGYELHASALDYSGFQPGELADVQIGDFLNSPQEKRFSAILSNPPYIRHHRIAATTKKRLRGFSEQMLGVGLDGRTGLHVYFLLRCLAALTDEGRLAFVLPADVFEGVSASRLWTRLCRMYRLHAVLTFHPDAAPFPRVDTNAVVVLMSREKPESRLWWLRVASRDAEAILRALTGVRKQQTDALTLLSRDLAEALATGLTRPPRKAPTLGRPLSDFATVMRGIATGENEFFFLSQDRIRELRLDRTYFRRAIGRTRDCDGSVLELAHLNKLEKKGRPTWLLSLGAETEAAFPPPLRSYIKQGERLGLHRQALIGTRRPWYRMEHRKPPPILFAYLGRRQCRFILNSAKVVPLTGFLCVYPKSESPQFIEALWSALNHPATRENLVYVGKSYGQGALKVEPRSLDKLVLPDSVLKMFGLKVPAQSELFAKS